MILKFFLLNINNSKINGNPDFYALNTGSTPARGLQENIILQSKDSNIRVSCALRCQSCKEFHMGLYQSDQRYRTLNLRSCHSVQ